MAKLALRPTMTEPAAEPSAETRQRIERLISKTVVAVYRPAGGYTLAERWVVRFADGTSAFVKVGVTDETARGLRQEARVYASVAGEFMPQTLAWDGGVSPPILVLEDLSGAAWPPPWNQSRIAQVLAALRSVSGTPAPSWLPAGTSDEHNWERVAADPTPFLSLGLCSPAWLEHALPVLIAAESEAEDALCGSALLHNDIRSDNICFRNDRALLIDWSQACRGDPSSDVAMWLPSLQAEGGPLPEDVSREASKYASLIAGFMAARAGLPPTSHAPFARTLQLTQLSYALPWAIRTLRLSPPNS